MPSLFSLKRDRYSRHAVLPCTPLLKSGVRLRQFATETVIYLQHMYVPMASLALEWCRPFYPRCSFGWDAVEPVMHAVHDVPQAF